jgi:hypothetical protein
MYLLREKGTAKERFIQKVRIRYIEGKFFEKGRKLLIQTQC